LVTRTGNCINSIIADSSTLRDILSVYVKFSRNSCFPARAPALSPWKEQGAIPTTLGRPLGFIVSELITNSVKHGKGNIVVRIQTPSSNNHLISVTDNGPGLPAEFSLDDGKGLGMKIIQALVKEIDGKLLVLRGESQPGAHFAISFQSPPLECAARLETLVDNPARAVLSRSTQVTPLERQKIPEPRWSAQ